jgi:hypothetical protein
MQQTTHNNMKLNIRIVDRQKQFWAFATEKDERRFWKYGKVVFATYRGSELPFWPTYPIAKEITKQLVQKVEVDDVANEFEYGTYSYED